MHQDDLEPFLALLNDVYTLYGKALSEGAQAMFFRALAAYPLAAVRTALDTHVKDPQRGAFAPKPADIIAQLESEDGRVGAEEAWAIALMAQDEAATVVWTTEIAQAFGVARPILTQGDLVGARMAFKDAYQRQVAAARRAGQAVQWYASLGWEAKQRLPALTQAATAGQLTHETVAALLPAPTHDESGAALAKSAPAILAYLRTYLATQPSALERTRATHQAQIRAQQRALAAKKRVLLEQARRYLLTRLVRLLDGIRQRQAGKAASCSGNDPLM